MPVDIQSLETSFELLQGTGPAHQSVPSLSIQLYSNHDVFSGHFNDPSYNDRCRWSGSLIFRAIVLMPVA